MRAAPRSVGIIALLLLSDPWAFCGQKLNEKAPLMFERNEGQTHPDVKFLSRGPGYNLFLTSTEAVIRLRKLAGPKVPNQITLLRKFGETDNIRDAESAVLRIRLIGANRRPPVVGLEELAGKVNYFVGNDSKNWRTNIPSYAKVRYEQVYPGVDLVYSGKQQQLEYDLVVAPRIDPGSIALAFDGADHVEVDVRGDLVLYVGSEQMRLQKPTVYQEISGIRQRIPGYHVLRNANEVGIEIGAYDASRPLVIDPVLVYSTYLGGARELGPSSCVAVDAFGNAYVTGSTQSASFPTTSAFQPRLGGQSDAFVAKLNATGTSLVYSTYLGGSGSDLAYGIAVDAFGNAYVTGETGSADFPTLNALQPRLGGQRDAFVAKLNATGTALAYSTYLGGSADDSGHGIAVDSFGSTYVTGFTRSVNFPRANPIQSTFGGGTGDAFVAKLTPAGSAFVYSTYLGGNNGDEGSGIALDAAGNAYVTGSTWSTNFPKANALQASFGGGVDDAFVAKVNATGTALLYSTYLGGSSRDNALGIAVDASGNAYLTGNTDSADFPVTRGSLKTSLSSRNAAFVTKLNSEGTALLYSTFLSGSTSDWGVGIAVDLLGNAYVAGVVFSSNFPTTPDAFQNSLRGRQDAFVAQLNARGTVLNYSTLLGGDDIDTPKAIAVDAAGNAYVIGYTSSKNFPVTPGVVQRNLVSSSGDVFISKVSGTVTTVSAASFLRVTLAPSSIASAFGQGLAATTDFADGTPLPTSLGNTTVRVKDSADTERRAPLFFVSPVQINYQVPDGTQLGPAIVTVARGDQTVASGVLQIDAVGPGLFSANADGQGVAAALIVRVLADGTQAFEPAFRCGTTPGSCVSTPIDLGIATDQVILVLFGTAIRGRTQLSSVNVKIGGTDAQVLFAGPQAEFVGLDQVNVRVPRSLIGHGEDDLVLTVDGRRANTVRLHIR